MQAYPDFLAQWEAAVAGQGDRLALTDGTLGLTFREVDALTDRLGRALLDRSVAAERLVGLDLARPLDFVIGMIATLKAGGAFMVADRHGYGRRDGGAAPFLWLSPSGRASGPDVLDIGLASEAPAAGPIDWRANLISSRQLAYVLHTSGFTGRPKAVMIERGNFAAFLCGVRAALVLSPDDRWLQLAPPTFDVFLEEVFPILASGGRAILRDRVEPLDFPRLDSALAAGVTIVEMTTQYFHEYQAWLRRSGRTPPDCLETVIVGGEKMDHRVYAYWQAHFRPRLIHVYGITETSVTSTLYFDRHEPSESDVPLGRPVRGARVRIASVSGEGGAGEILIGGAGVGRGYAGEPAMTAARFRPDDRGRPGARVYHSGDFGHMSVGGQLVFDQRRDAEIKLAGRRLNIAALEAEVLSIPEVAQCAIVRQSERGASLAAFVVPRDPGEAGASQTIDQLVRARLAGHFPAWAVPGRVDVLAELPKTPHGKVDRQALTAGPRSSDGPASGAAAGEGTLGLVLAVFREALDHGDFQPGDDFFDHGGDSLSALSIVSRLIDLCDCELTVADIFDHSTPIRLSGKIASVS